ncbi:MAG: hypothetical protein IH624_16615 [Phycisphaerae bacterium]|nr:hypothetical protein [Phycisphaerae bacterium]
MKSLHMCAVALLGVFVAQARAECSLDHFIIGINEDGIAGTEDDQRLFADCRQKYRRSGSPAYVNWYYPLSSSIFSDYKWRIGEPGFDAFQQTYPGVSTYDPNRCPEGVPDENYRIIVECIAVSPGLRAVHKDYPQFTIDQAGQSFNHSAIHKMRSNAHMHMSYQAVDGTSLFWITWRLVDALDDGDKYAPSKPFTVVFNRQPLSGDLVVDGIVDCHDLAAFLHHWLHAAGAISNDNYERADANRDGHVDFMDFAMLAANWLTVQD